MSSKNSAEELKYQQLHWNDDEDALVIGASVAFCTASLIAVSLRLLARREKKISCSYDDFFIVIAQLLALGLLIENLIAVRYGIGKHLLRAGIDNGVKDLELGLASEITYISCHLAIKVSILQLYCRLFTTNRRTFKIAVYALGTYVIAWAIASLCVVLLQCKPLQYSWEELRADTNGRCVNLLEGYLATTVTNTLSDFAILVLPIPIVWRLQMKRRQKVIICGIFLLGGFACTASVLRIYYLAKSTSDAFDSTYADIQPLIWFLIECCTGIICACLPTLRPLFQSCSSRLSHLRRRLADSLYFSARQSSDDQTIAHEHGFSRGITISDPTDASLRRIPSSITAGLDIEEQKPFSQEISGIRGSWLLGSQESLPRAYHPGTDVYFPGSYV